MPTVATVGSRPIAAVATPMIRSVTMKAYFRPTMSPMRPNTSAPSGRTAKPAPNVANVFRNAAVSLELGKNKGARIGASVPKT
jgi:hypothetical protein